MDFIAILATTHESQIPEHAETILPLDTMWQHITSMQALEALMFIAFGCVCLFYGWRIFKMLVVISFSLIGLAIGWFFTERFIVGLNPLWGGIAGMIVLGVASMSLLKWAVCILGAVSGGMITGSIWYSVGLSDQYLWAGALIGVIAGGMISFIIFKIAIMLFSSLSGSLLIITGILTLLYLHPSTQDNLQQFFFTKRWFLPVIITLPTIIGLYIQNKFVKGSAEWSV